MKREDLHRIPKEHQYLRGRRGKGYLQITEKDLSEGESGVEEPRGGEVHG